jgi:hypothetical protein
LPDPKPWLDNAGTEEPLQARVAEAREQGERGPAGTQRRGAGNVGRRARRPVAALVAGLVAELALLPLEAIGRKKVAGSRRSYAQCAFATQANGCGPCGTLDPTISALHVPAAGWLTCMTSTLFVASSVMTPDAAA